MSRYLGIETEKNAQQEPRSFRRMATLMFDTKVTDTITTSNPFSAESSLKDNAVKVKTTFLSLILFSMFDVVLAVQPSKFAVVVVFFFVLLVIFSHYQR